MSKSIASLVEDIYGLFGSGHEPSQASIDEFAKAVGTHVKDAFKKREPKGTVRGSNVGTRCSRKLYYDVNSPGDAEPLEPHVLLKFLYGNILEELAFLLVEEAGHTVTNRQQEVSVEDVLGHVDGVVDGVIIDVKTASGYGINKFKDHKIETDDPFGYLDQIDFYREGLKNAPEVSIRGTAGFLAIDKSSGQIYLDLYRRSEENSKAIVEKVRKSVSMVAGGDLPPRGFSDIPDGKSGNRRLCVECSYCPYKQSCWPNLRKFLYSSGPRWFSKVEKEPRIDEIL